MQIGRTRQDNLRVMAARDATQLAMQKWERLGYGVNAADDPDVRRLAQAIHHALTLDLRLVNERLDT